VNTRINNPDLRAGQQVSRAHSTSSFEDREASAILRVLGPGEVSP
jgi:hypothetical protein